VNLALGTGIACFLWCQNINGESNVPAKSKKQRKMMSIAEHHPEKLYKKNRNVLKMSSQDLHDFASTKEKGLPKKRKSPMEREREKVARKRRGY
jgi:hypothetical protein